MAAPGPEMAPPDEGAAGRRRRRVLMGNVGGGPVAFLPRLAESYAMLADSSSAFAVSRSAVANPSVKQA